MPSLLLSEEYEEIAFLRFFENENFEDGLSILFEKIVSCARRFVIADFGAINAVPDGVILKIADFADEIEKKYFRKLCIVGQSAALHEKKIAPRDNFLKIFRNIGDAINYFYWDCCRNRDVVTMKMPSDMRLVPLVRESIRDFMELCGISERTMFQMGMVVDELCNNAIEHGTQDESKTIEVLCLISVDRIEINVYNGYNAVRTKEKHGHELKKDMEKWANSPNQTGNEFRGRGLALVKKVSDSFEINSSHDGTWIHITKKKGQADYANAN